MSIAATHNITIDQGSDFELSIILQEEDGTVTDLTGYSARGQIRQSKDASEIAATFTCTIGTPASGEILLALGNSVTKLLTPSTSAGEYYYDIEIFTSGDIIVKRILQGRVVVTQEVTR